MKIAQVSPLFERVPPQGYGGTERVISYLTEELVRRGHEVTLFASGDSITTARLISPVAQAIRQDTGRQAWLAYYAIQLGQVADLAHELDIIHFHTEHMHFPMANRLPTPHLTTVHGRLDLPELAPLYRYFNDCPLVSISNSQRAPAPAARWCGTVYHGLPPRMYTFNKRPDDYFCFVGRISPEKRVDRAIEIAQRCGARLKIAAKVDKFDEPYFQARVKPLLSDSTIEFLGELNDHDKRVLLANARGLLFPIDWPEPFGLVMIEALACGTPVIAYPNGAIPEIVQHGVTGYLVHDQEEAVQAAQRIGDIDRRQCRAAFEQRFTAKTMADNYLRLYETIVEAPKLADRVVFFPDKSVRAAPIGAMAALPSSGDSHG